MDKKRLLKLAGIVKEEAPKTTKDNPLVDLWEGAESKDYEAQGLMGHMHLSTAANIHRFDTQGLAEELAKAGVGKRIKAGKIYLEYSHHNAKYLNEKSPTYSVANSKVEEMLDKIASVLASEAKELAGEVYDEEGAGRSGAKSKQEYVVWAVKRFLDNEYKRSIIKHLADSYKEEITEGRGRAQDDWRDAIHTGVMKAVHLGQKNPEQVMADDIKKIVDEIEKELDGVI